MVALNTLPVSVLCLYILPAASSLFFTRKQPDRWDVTVMVTLLSRMYMPVNSLLNLQVK